MKIAISLNDVLRGYTQQFAYVYDKYLLYGIEDEEEALEAKNKVNLEKNPIKDFNLENYFKFDSTDDYNTFLYKDASLEIFGHADEIGKNVMTKFNNFIMDIRDEEEHEIELVGREVHMAIPSTMFFLSKTACRCGNVRLVRDYDNIWDGVDVLISADPNELKNKPDGKVSVKIKTSYNEDVDSDYTFDTIIDVITNEEKLDEILNKQLN